MRHVTIHPLPVRQNGPRGIASGLCGEVIKVFSSYHGPRAIPDKVWPCSICEVGPRSSEPVEVCSRKCNINTALQLAADALLVFHISDVPSCPIVKPRPDTSVS